MNIKSLLLGSTAAFIAVSGAQAADAIVVEPEPVEYVRVCDAYGSGFFYIPGTETCIRFSGYVRSSYEKTYVDRTPVLPITTGTTATFTTTALTLTDGGGLVPPVAPATGSFETTFWGQRARLDIDTRNETDWGTLRAQYRLEGGDANDDANIDMDRALISLAGFRAGFTDNYWSTNHGYAGVNLTGLGSSTGYTSDDGWYGFNDATMFDYTWAGDGFSVTVGVEDPRLDYVVAPFRIALPGPTFTGTAATGFANFYAGFNYSADWGGVAFTALHDSTAIVYSNTAPVTQGGWVYKVSADLDLSQWIPGGILHGMYMWDDDLQSNYVVTSGAIDDPKSVLQVSFQADVSDELQFVAQYSYAEGSDFVFLGTSEGDAYSASLGLNWFPAAAPGFSVRGSYKFGEIDNGVKFGTNTFGFYDEEWHGFFVGVRRDF